MEDKILKFATAVVVVLTVAVCIGLPFFPQIHTWAVESREERLAELGICGKPDRDERS